jgi:hypothetical protein
MKRLEPILDTAYDFARNHAWPWNLIGVFPSVDDIASDPDARWAGFCYTVGLGTYEVWMPAISVEQRHVDLNFCGTLVNSIALATRDGVLVPGDDVAFPVGIADAEGNWSHDADAVLWIGQIEPAGRRQTYQSPAQSVLPVLWSSPLGFADE